MTVDLKESVHVRPSSTEGLGRGIDRALFSGVRYRTGLSDTCDPDLYLRKFTRKMKGEQVKQI